MATWILEMTFKPPTPNLSNFLTPGHADSLRQKLFGHLWFCFGSCLHHFQY